jgi:hypothetical protein
VPVSSFISSSGLGYSVFGSSSFLGSSFLGGGIAKIPLTSESRRSILW